MSLSVQLQEALAKTRVSWRYGGKAVAVKMRVGGEVVGHIQVMKGMHPPEKTLKGCAADVEALRAKGHGTEQAWFVTNVNIEKEHRGTGLGKRLYQTAFDAIVKKGGSAMVGSHDCAMSGGTSSDAKRVWVSMAKKYPSSGSVVVVGGR